MARSTAPSAASTEDLPVTADLFVCPNCETTTPGPFCFHCGQKRPVDADLSLRHAGRYVIEELLNLDGRLLTTVKLLFTRPWQLTLDFFEGRRARHVHPLRLFLAFSAVFFLVRASTMTTAFDSRLGVRVTSSMRAQAQEEGVPFETVVARNDQRLALVYKSAFIVGTLLTGVWLWLFFRREHPYLAQHMVVALHFSCIAMAAVVTADVVQLAMRSGPRNPTALGGGRLGGALLGLTIVFFLGPMITRVYQRGWKGATAQLVLGAVALLVIMSAMVLPVFASSRYLQSLLR